MDIDAVIDEHGWALQAVLDDGPAVPPFTYTIGLFDRLPDHTVLLPIIQADDRSAGRSSSQPSLSAMAGS